MPAAAGMTVGKKTRRAPVPDGMTVSDILRGPRSRIALRASGMTSSETVIPAGAQSAESRDPGSNSQRSF